MRRNNKFITFMGGTGGFVVVLAVIIVALAVSGYAAFTALRISARYASAYADEPSDVTTLADTTVDQIESDTSVQTTEPIVPEESTASESESAESESETVTEEITEAETFEPDEERIIICLDPGHGYDDPGTDSEWLGELSEKDITLDISKRVAAIINERYSGELPLDIYLTRESDEAPEGAERNKYGQYLFGPQKREAYIESLGYVDALVSIHCDYYAEDSKRDGVCIFYSLNVNKSSVSLGLDIANGILTNVGKSESGREPDVQYTYYDDAYYMTKCTPFPAVLIECGFISNETEAKNMLDDEWKDKMAEGIAQGIMAFLHI